MFNKNFKKTTKYFFISILFSSLVFYTNYVKAVDSNSSSFGIIDSSFNNLHKSTSTHFSILGALSQFSIGQSTSSLSTFMINSGILYFPKVTSPLLSASAGNAQATLSWTASQGFLGTNIGGYLVGQSSVSGGPYTFASVGNVTNAVRSSLNNGQTYYFIVESQDAFGDIVAKSGEVSAVPVAPIIIPPVVTPPSTAGGGGGGGGGGAPSPSGDTTTASADTKITLKGLAYPFAKIVILKDAAIGAQVTADALGNFQATFPASVGTYSFGIYALDKDGFKSPTFGFTVNSRSGQTVTTSDVVVAPTIGADKTMVKVGNNIEFFGYAYPVSSINIMINSEKEILDKAVADKYGRWTYSLKSSVLELGDHTAKTQTIATQDLASSYSAPLAFKVGNEDILADNSNQKNNLCSTHGDINGDGKVNITDFSILMYFWNKASPSNACADINGDGKVNLQDFSIMLYWWTGK